MTPFLVLSLPRSRSYWASRWLSWGNRECEHDPARHFTSRADIAVYFQRPNAAAVDTSLGRIWREIAAEMPAKLRVAVIHRAAPEVAASLRRIGFQDVDVRALKDFSERLWAIQNAQHFAYSDLSTWDGCRRLFRFCRHQEPSQKSYARLSGTYLECDLRAYMLDALANREGVARVFAGRDAEAA